MQPDRKPHGSASAQPSGVQAAPTETPQQRTVIAIPSYREVQAAQRAPAAVTNLFRPTSSNQREPGPGGAPTTGVAAHVPQWNQHQVPHQQQQQQQIMRPPPPLPPPQQQQQHQFQPPQQQQQGQRYQPSAPPTNIPHTTTTTNPNNTNQLPSVNPNVITVSRRQQGNPVLKYIRNVRWQYGDIIPDYLLGQSTIALFLSLRYHLLNPNYVHTRIKEIGRAYRLRVLLVHVDTEDAVEPLAQVTRAAIGNEFTLLCGFSNAECGRYLETLKSYEKKPAEIIQ